MSLPNNHTYQDRIEAYLLEEMSPDEKLTFEQEMQTDPSLERDVEAMREMHAEIASWEQDAFLEQLNQIREELDANADTSGTDASSQESDSGNEAETSMGDSPPRKGLPRWYFAVAAAILLLIVPLYFILRPSPSLFEQYFDPYQDRYTSRASADEEIKQAFSDYNKGQYEESLVHFENYLKVSPSDSQAVFYNGVAHLAAGQPEKAIDQLSTLQQPDFLFFIQAKWYLALAYLQANQTETAKTILESLANSDNSFQQKAGELLEELD